MITGRPPPVGPASRTAEHNGIRTLATEIVPKGNGAKYPTLDPELRDFLARCLAWKAEDRPDLSTMLTTAEDALRARTAAASTDSTDETDEPATDTDSIDTNPDSNDETGEATEDPDDVDETDEAIKPLDNTNESDEAIRDMIQALIYDADTYEEKIDYIVISS